MMTSAEIRSVIASMRVQMKLSFQRPMTKFMLFVQPIFFSYLNANAVMAGTRANQVIFGSSLMSLWSIVIFASAAELERERAMGTLESLFASPAGIFWISVGKTLGNFAFGLGAVSLCIIYSVFGLGLRVSIPNGAWTVLAVLLLLVQFIEISLLLSALFVSMRNARTYINAAEYPIFVLCGFAFPVSVLPLGLKITALAVPVTWSVGFARMTILGEFWNSSLPIMALINLALIATLGILIRATFRMIERMARFDGTLALE